MVVSETTRDEDLPDIAYNTCTFRYAIILLEKWKIYDPSVWEKHTNSPI